MAVERDVEVQLTQATVESEATLETPAALAEGAAAQVEALAIQTDRFINAVEKDVAAGINVSGNTVTKLEKIKHDARNLGALFIERLVRIIQRVKASLRSSRQRVLPSETLQHLEEVITVEPEVLSDEQRFLLDKPATAITALETFSDEQQHSIVDSWKRHKNMDWPGILQDDQAGKLVPIILAFPDRTTYHGSTDRIAVLAMSAECTPGQIVSAWEKAGQPRFCSWDEVYARVTVGNFEYSTTEQMSSLNKEQWHYLKIVLYAYGKENISSIWENEANLDKFKQDTEYIYGTHRVDDFVKNLSEEQRRHLPSIPTPVDYKDLINQLETYQEYLEVIPVQNRNAVLQVIEPCSRYYVSREQENITSEQAENFVTYINLCETNQQYTLGALLHNARYFSNESWDKVQAGVQTCSDNALTLPTKADFNTSLQVYEQAGLPEQAVTNQFLKHCQQRSAAYIAQGKYAAIYEAKMRTVESIFNIQKFQEIYQKYFITDFNLVAQFLQFDDQECAVVRWWADHQGSTDDITTRMDVSVIEGSIVQLGKNFSTRNFDDLDSFIALTLEQKTHWLLLRSVIRCDGGRVNELFTLTKSDDCVSVIQFLQTTGLTQYKPDTVLTMAKRPDCIDLFQYLAKLPQVNYDREQTVINKLIALRDAGLPVNLNLTVSAVTRDENVVLIDKLIEWDTSKLVHIAQFVATEYPALPFYEVIKLNSAITLEQALLSIQYAAAERSMHVLDYKNFTKEEIDLLQQRRNEAEIVLHTTCTSSEINKIAPLSQESWKKLSTSDVILKHYLVGKYSDFPEVGAALPDDLLTNSMIWQYNFPNDFWADAKKMASALAIAESLTKAEVILQNHNQLWEELLTAHETAPWLFTEETLALFSGDTVRILLSCVQCSQEEWQQILPEFKCFSFQSVQQIDDFIQRWRNGDSLLNAEQISALQQYVQKIPAAEVQDIVQRLQQGETLEVIINTKDTPRDALALPNVWQQSRVDFYRCQVQADVPTFGKYKKFSVADWQTIAQLSQPALQWLEQLAPLMNVYGYTPELAQLITIANHKNKAVVLKLLQYEHSNCYQVFFQPLEKLASFCDRLTEDTVERWRNWPKQLKIKTADVVDFFAQPQADAIITLAQELRNIFGDTFTMSVYDLLIMDSASDLANLQQLQRNCALPITPDYLRRLVHVATGDMQRTITKLLAMFDKEYKIDFGESKQQLLQLKPNLRTAALLEKGPGNFGWSILAHRQILLDSGGLTDEDFNKLVCTIYRDNRSTVPRLDVAAARALLWEPIQDSKYKIKQLEDVLQYCGGVEKNQLDTTQYLATLLGEQLTNLQKKPEIMARLAQAVAANQFQRLETVMAGNDLIIPGAENWLPLVMAFVRTTIEDVDLPRLDKNVSEKITALFKGADVKDLCLNQLQQLWKQYLNNEHTNEASFQLVIVTNFVNACEGAGPMSQFEALSLFIYQLQTCLTKETTIEDTRTGVMSGMQTMEQRFISERWSNEDKTDFYNISRDMVQADPNLFNDFLQVFAKLKASELKKFHTEIYPLYRAQLAVLAQSSGKMGALRYQTDDLVLVRKSLQEFSNNTDSKAAFNTLRQDLITELTNKFKTRFGIVRIPEQFTTEHIRSLTNITLYLGNLHDRSQDKEHLLGWYLALMVNDKWDAYRRGEILDPGDYLASDQAVAISEILKQRQELNPLTAEQLHLAADDLPKFQAMLQTETPNIALGDVETIDVKLGNVIVNLRTLEDLDLYPDPLDKSRMQLLLEFGNKQVGAVAAKLYSSLNNPSKEVVFSETETVVKIRLQDILVDNNILLTAAMVKTHFQDSLKSLAVVVNTIKLVEDTKAMEEIIELQKLLRPSDAIVAVFNRLGEEFNTSSGALALTQDLDYLDTIIVKRETELTPEESSLLKDHVATIRAQVIKLQSVYDKIKSKFGTTRNAQAMASNELLRNKLVQIDQTINAETAQQVVVSTMTHQMNSIIENIRECLSCVRQGCNNDTDLTFGDMNKFFIYSHTESQSKGSIADEIVFLEPVTTVDGKTEISFVLDRVYGTCTPFILTNHISTVFKKYRALKKTFPEVGLSVFVTDAAISTGGVSVEQLSDRVQTALGKDVTITHITVDVDVVKSATADHYVEFGGGARVVGKRSVSGLLLKI